MSKPILSKIGVFDATAAQTIRFAVYDEISSITYVIYDNETGNILTYANATPTGTGRYRTFTLPAGTLTNRLDAYYICIRSTLSDGSTTEYSDKILFYCHTTPTIKFADFSSNVVVKYPSYAFDLVYTYDEAQGEMINNYKYVLYDVNKEVLKESSTYYYSDPLKSFIADGMDDSATYYIRALAETINGYELDTGYITFTTSFDKLAADDSTLTLTNNYYDGTITATANVHLDKSDNITALRLKRRKVSTRTWTGLTEVAIDDTSYKMVLSWHNGTISSSTGVTGSARYAVYSPAIILAEIDHVFFNSADNEFAAFYYGENEVYLSATDYGTAWDTAQAPDNAVFVRFCIVSTDGHTTLDTSENNGLTIYSNKDGYVSIVYVDKYATGRNTQYEYAIVPVSDNDEQSYIKNTVRSNFDGAIIADTNTTYHITLDATVTGVTRNREASVVTTLSRKYPYVFHGGESNYYSGTFEGTGIEQLEGDEFDIDGGNEYRDTMIDWLTNGEAKVLKMNDGRAWLMCVNGSVSIDQSEHIDKGTISFEFVEVGDLFSDEDLYENELIDYNESDEGVS